MMWQDIVITIANLIFAYALIPQVIQGFKKKKSFINLQTSLFTTIAMYSMAIAFFSLNLTFSWEIGLFNATMWLLLLTQRIIYKKAE